MHYHTPRYRRRPLPDGWHAKTLTCTGCERRFQTRPEGNWNASLCDLCIMDSIEMPIEDHEWLDRLRANPRSLEIDPPMTTIFGPSDPGSAYTRWRRAQRQVQTLIQLFTTYLASEEFVCCSVCEQHRPPSQQSKNEQGESHPTMIKRD
jgi:hypothetical protein